MGRLCASRMDGTEMATVRSQGGAGMGSVPEGTVVGA